MTMTGVYPADGVGEPGDQAWMTAELSAIVEHRALIEQAKGMLMFVYGIDADAAFDVMRKQSQENNVKLRLIAQQILTDLVELSRSRGPVRRLAFDGLLTTAHTRITRRPDRERSARSASR